MDDVILLRRRFVYFPHYDGPSTGYGNGMDIARSSGNRWSVYLIGNRPLF